MTGTQTAFDKLNFGVRFIAGVPRAGLPILAESVQTPRRAILQIDNDTSESGGGGQRRLVR